MYTYQLHQRVLACEAPLTFPGNATIHIELTPAAAFGFDVPGVSAKAGSDVGFAVDLDSGRTSVLRGRLEKFAVERKWEGGSCTVAGNEIIVEAPVASDSDLVDLIMPYQHMLPPLLAVEIADPVAVTRVWGELDGVLFYWRFSEMALPQDGTTEELQTERTARAIDRVSWMRPHKNWRLAAAVAYHHTARRLICAGVTRWEFMGPAILNLNKALEVLFCDTRICDNSNRQTERELELLGLPKEDRRPLISLMKLRNHVDVAHVDTWLFDPDDLAVLYRLIDRVIQLFPAMLSRLLEAVENNTYELKASWPPEPADDVKKLLEFIKCEYPELRQCPPRRRPAQYFEQAVGKYQRAAAIHPDDYRALCNRGSALLGRASLKSGKAAETLFKQAGEEYEKAAAINPGAHDPFYNWGYALFEQAKLKSGKPAETLFKQAGDKYEKAAAIKPDDYEAFTNWGNALVEQGRLTSGKAAETLFKQAGDKYEKAATIKPDEPKAFTNWGMALFEQAKLKSGKPAETLFKQAVKKLEEANASTKGAAAYNLACLSALRGHADDAFRWLEQAVSTSHMPPMDHARGDPDLESIRDDPRFQSLLLSPP